MSGTDYEQEFNDLKRRMKIIIEVAKGETVKSTDKSNQTPYKLNCDPPLLSRQKPMEQDKPEIKQVQKTLHYFYGYK